MSESFWCGFVGFGIFAFACLIVGLLTPKAKKNNREAAFDMAFMFGCVALFWAFVVGVWSCVGGRN